MKDREEDGKVRRNEGRGEERWKGGKRKGR